MVSATSPPSAYFVASSSVGFRTVRSQATPAITVRCTQPVVPQHDHREQQFVQVAGGCGSPLHQRGASRIKHQEVGLASDLQVADHALQPQGGGRACRVSFSCG